MFRLVLQYRPYIALRQSAYQSELCLPSTGQSKAVPIQKKNIVLIGSEFNEKREDNSYIEGCNLLE